VPSPLPPGAPRTVPAANPTDVRQPAGQRSAKHLGTRGAIPRDWVGSPSRPGCRIQALSLCRFRAFAPRGLLAPARRLETMHGFSSRRDDAFAQTAPLPSRIVLATYTAGACCAGATRTNRSEPRYPRAGTASRTYRLRLNESYSSAPLDDDRTGKPGATRGRKATGLGHPVSRAAEAPEPLTGSSWRSRRP
jgi:hypothetical protein